MTKKSILIIDDDVEVRLMLWENLKECGYDVTAAGDGEEGLMLLETRPPPDLLITDIIMPRTDGLQVIAEARVRHPGMKIVAISGGGRNKSGDFLAMAHGLGCNEILRKPFDMAQFEATVARLVE